MLNSTIAIAVANMWADFWAEQLVQEKGKIAPEQLLSARITKMLSFGYCDGGKSRYYDLLSKVNTARAEIRLGDLSLEALERDLDSLGLKTRTIYEKGDETYISVPYKDLQKAIVLIESLEQAITQKLSAILLQKTDILSPSEVGGQEYCNHLSSVVTANGNMQLIIMPRIGNYSEQIVKAIGSKSNLQAADFEVYLGSPGHHVSTEKLCAALDIKHPALNMQTAMQQRGDFGQSY